ncbi:Uncharacterized protein dnm_050310 [Desulfonema magnum]|uniref:Uncharacterized protein n=1 Tax=Desulfonema magnum TaxID=45655 RepID=A0A975BP01_9BACT|nr:Uncharacterized protein dnm_050310 [Desulfonema magnum]
MAQLDNDILILIIKILRILKDFKTSDNSPKRHIRDGILRPSSSESFISLSKKCLT